VGGGAAAAGAAHLKTSAYMSERSVAPKESTARLPPARTTFRLRSFTESSLTFPMSVQPAATVGSVLRRTRAIASVSASSAQATAVGMRSKSPAHVVLMFMSSRVG
jgi:hypothetical protein